MKRFANTQSQVAPTKGGVMNLPGVGPQFTVIDPSRSLTRESRTNLFGSPVDTEGERLFPFWIDRTESTPKIRIFARVGFMPELVYRAIEIDTFNAKRKFCHVVGGFKSDLQNSIGVGGTSTFSRVDWTDPQNDTSCYFSSSKANDLNFSGVLGLARLGQSNSLELLCVDADNSRNPTGESYTIMIDPLNNNNGDTDDIHQAIANNNVYITQLSDSLDPYHIQVAPLSHFDKPQIRLAIAILSGYINLGTPDTRADYYAHLLEACTMFGGSFANNGGWMILDKEGGTTDVVNTAALMAVSTTTQLGVDDDKLLLTGRQYDNRFAYIGDPSSLSNPVDTDGGVLEVGQSYTIERVEEITLGGKYADLKKPILKRVSISHPTPPPLTGNAGCEKEVSTAIDRINYYLVKNLRVPQGPNGQPKTLIHPATPTSSNADGWSVDSEFQSFLDRMAEKYASDNTPQADSKSPYGPFFKAIDGSDSNNNPTSPGTGSNQGTPGGGASQNSRGGEACKDSRARDLIRFGINLSLTPAQFVRVAGSALGARALQGTLGANDALTLAAIAGAEQRINSEEAIEGIVLDKTQDKDEGRSQPTPADRKTTTSSSDSI